ncbi:MAG: hypothetical protein EHM45_07660 [Desulfobacteraceae bacterium]|nr:MAG: hypothetical protein EHM45_07660 [Desulfobacteraceae bacterium]
MTNQKVADDVIAHCSSCKKDLNHTIVAIDEDKIIRVLCATCKKEHAYRAPREDKPLKKKRAVKRASSKKNISPLEEWEKAMEQIKELSAKPYTLAGRFEAGEKLDHSTFGLGLVKNVSLSNKMDVVFKEGTKMLVWGRS